MKYRTKIGEGICEKRWNSIERRVETMGKTCARCGREVEGARKKWCAACAKERHNEQEKARYKRQHDVELKERVSKKKKEEKPAPKEKPLSLGEVEKLRAAVNRTRRAAGLPEYSSYGKFVLECGENLRALYVKHCRDFI
jgi:hypothetical protein